MQEFRVRKGELAGAGNHVSRPRSSGRRKMTHHTISLHRRSTCGVTVCLNHIGKLLLLGGRFQWRRSWCIRMSRNESSTMEAMLSCTLNFELRYHSGSECRVMRLLTSSRRRIVLSYWTYQERSSYGTGTYIKRESTSTKRHLTPGCLFCLSEKLSFAR